MLRSITILDTHFRKHCKYDSYNNRYSSYIIYTYYMQHGHISIFCDIKHHFYAYPHLMWALKRVFESQGPKKMWVPKNTQISCDVSLCSLTI